MRPDQIDDVLVPLYYPGIYISIVYGFCRYLWGLFLASMVVPNIDRLTWFWWRFLVLYYKGLHNFSAESYGCNLRTRVLTMIYLSHLIEQLKGGQYRKCWFNQLVFCYCSWSQLLETLPLPNVRLSVQFKSFSSFFIHEHATHNTVLLCYHFNDFGIFLYLNFQCRLSGSAQLLLLDQLLYLVDFLVLLVRFYSCEPRALLFLFESALKYYGCCKRYSCPALVQM